MVQAHHHANSSPGFLLLGASFCSLTIGSDVPCQPVDPRDRSNEIAIRHVRQRTDVSLVACIGAYPARRLYPLPRLLLVGVVALGI